MKQKYSNGLNRLNLSQTENDYIYNSIKDHLVLTGSRCYGGADIDSDYDYIIMKDELPPFLYDRIKYFTDGSHNDYCETVSFYLIDPNDKDRVLNINVFQSKKEYAAWIKTNLTLQQLYETEHSILKAMMVNDKQFRIRLFETIFVYELNNIIKG